MLWSLDAPFSAGADGCEHGGASLSAIGADFGDLGRRERVVGADVLDAWFAPSPGVEAALAVDPAWWARTSPPADAGGLVTAIASACELPSASIAVGAGSSDLIFRAFTHWLGERSRVLLVEPSYGEYSHVAERVVGCRVDRFRLRRQNGWAIDAERLAATVRSADYDLVVVVNPNNPTGRHLPRTRLQAAIAATPERTRWWIDETYFGYVGLEESLADLAAVSPRVVVCSSLSKMYALSGMRVAFLTAAAEVTAEIRLRTPPWPVSLPAQMAAVAALRDPAYYASCWRRTHDLRRALADSLNTLADVEVDESTAGFLTLTLPTGGPSPHQFVSECRQNDVYLRDLSAMSPAYEGRTIRIAVRGPAENERIATTCAIALSSTSQSSATPTAS